MSTKSTSTHDSKRYPHNAEAMKRHSETTPTPTQAEMDEVVVSRGAPPPVAGRAKRGAGGKRGKAGAKAGGKKGTYGRRDLRAR